MAREFSVHLVSQDAGARIEWGRILEARDYDSASFGSAGDFLARGLSARPDCVIAEAVLGDCGGLELQERTRSFDATISVVFVSGKADFRMIVRAMRAGAIDFLEKPVAEGALVDAVARATQRAAALRAVEERRMRARARFVSLTPRERAILAQVLEGRLNKQIAATLECQEATVKVHRSRLMRKLGVRSLARLVQLAQDLGFDRPADDLRSDELVAG